MKKKNRQPDLGGQPVSDWIWSPDEGKLERIEREAGEGEDYGEAGDPETEPWDIPDERFAAEDEEDAEASRDELRHAMVVKLIERIGQQLDAKDAPGKASVADLIRLMQLERALKPEQCRKFVVEWVDPQPEDM